MQTEMFLRLERAIGKVIDHYSESPLWDGLIEAELHRKMAQAAALVFDASMDGQAFAEKENG